MSKTTHRRSKAPPRASTVLLFESVSQSDPKISYKIHEDSPKLNYMISFYKKGKRIFPLGESYVYALPEQGLEVAKQMAESTIKEYL